MDVAARRVFWRQRDRDAREAGQDVQESPLPEPHPRPVRLLPSPQACTIPPPARSARGALEQRVRPRVAEDPRGSAREVRYPPPALASLRRRPQSPLRSRHRARSPQVHAHPPAARYALEQDGARGRRLRTRQGRGRQISGRFRRIP